MPWTSQSRMNTSRTSPRNGFDRISHNDRFLEIPPYHIKMGDHRDA